MYVGVAAALMAATFNFPRPSCRYHHSDSNPSCRKLAEAPRPKEIQQASYSSCPTFNRILKPALRYPARFCLLPFKSQVCSW